MTRMSGQIDIEDVMAFIDVATSDECLVLLAPIANRLGWRVGLERGEGECRGVVLGTKDFMEANWPDDGERVCMVHPSNEN